MIDPSKIVDVSLQASGAGLPEDHGYLLFSALCEALPRLSHEPGWALHLVDGRRCDGRILLTGSSEVRIRLPAADIGEALSLTGRELRVGLDLVVLGRAEVSMLQPADRLRAVVTMYGRTGLGFKDALRNELAALPLEQDIDCLSIEYGAQRTLRSRVRTMLGYDVEISGLRPWASLVLQAHGLGARRHMGAGVFTEAR